MPIDGKRWAPDRFPSAIYLDNLSVWIEDGEALYPFASAQFWGSLVIVRHTGITRWTSLAAQRRLGDRQRDPHDAGHGS